METLSQQLDRLRNDLLTAEQQAALCVNHNAQLMALVNKIEDEKNESFFKTEARKAKRAKELESAQNRESIARLVQQKVTHSWMFPRQRTDVIYPRQNWNFDSHVYSRVQREEEKMELTIRMLVQGHCGLEILRN